MLTRIANDHLTVDVSSLGAEMQTLTSSDGRDWLWNGDAAFWTGRSPILFPIVGKAPDNRLTINGASYEMNQHGFARRSEFTLVESSAAKCRYELAASDATRAVYPFAFRLFVDHVLDGRALTVIAGTHRKRPATAAQACLAVPPRSSCSRSSVLRRGCDDLSGRRRRWADLWR
jgi:galactose mutarotase-like enzyme